MEKEPLGPSFGPFGAEFRAELQESISRLSAAWTRLLEIAIVMVRSSRCNHQKYCWHSLHVFHPASTASTLPAPAEALVELLLPAVEVRLMWWGVNESL